MRFRFRGFAPLAASLLFLVASSIASADDDGRWLRLKAGSIDPLTALAAAATEDDGPDGGVRIVQFNRAIEPAVLDAVRGLGVELLGYLPDRA